MTRRAGFASSVSPSTGTTGATPPELPSLTRAQDYKGHTWS